MSRRRGEKQSRVLLFEYALFLLLSLNHFVNADGNVGCLYSNSLCDLKTEWCYDDSAFGRCIYKYGFVPEDLYKYRFKYEDLENLKEILEQLKTLEFTWKHLYTQCVVQTQLYAIRTGIQYDAEICDPILKQESTDPIRLLRYEQGLNRDSKVNNIPPRPATNEGIIKYGPDDEFNTVTGQQNGQDAYFQQKPDYESELLNQLRIQSSKLKPDVYKKNFKSTSSKYRGTPLYLPLHNRDKFKPSDENFVTDNGGGQSKISQSDWQVPSDNEKDVYNELITLQKAFNSNGDENAKAYSEGGAMSIGKKTEFENNVYDKILDQYGGKIFGFQRSERLDVKKPGPYYKVNNYAFGNQNTQDKPQGSGDEEKNVSNGYKRRVMKDVFSDLYPNYQSPSYEYVPGNYKNYNYKTNSYLSGMIQVDDNSSYVTIETNKDLSGSVVSQLVGKLTKLFNFPPGIFSNRKFYGNKLIFKIKQNNLNPTAAEVKRLIEESKAIDLTEGIRITSVYLGTPKDEIIATSSPEIENPDQYAVVDVNYAYIQLKEPIRNKAEGEKIIDSIERILQLPENTLYEVNSAVSEILFKVRPNAQNLNASELARRIDMLKHKIKNDLNIDITSVGIGDKDKLPTATRLSHTDDSLYMLTFIVCGVIGAVLVSAVVLYFTKRQSRLKDKLHKIIPSDKEFSKDYQFVTGQDLCRARMARKSSQEATSSGGQRITSLSRESDNSPSSRSSTSSWSEEPMTNMDITTGHMVLAYMEDHLNNKARLDTEWAALCAYDADPCSVAIAQLQENIRKNRYVNALPYDHARVILNALSNVNGSDYINASTITDHDPRNAAYIATQGPLENTVCDFWQMIWEQGCVVIVMLTRLVENDTSMCHRYWPLEGAELYNIYEVHLVSEHIWCDDFLVRSFYLKNLKTTETRTVTQFHFLTWPEGGIPSATKPLLEFRRKVNKSFRGRSCPIVVHCSDGVGRTGSYLLLDMVLNRISKGAKEIDIAATLEHIRDQRAGAVCTKQQFQFVLSAVAEEVQAALRALPQQQSSAQDQSADATAPAPSDAAGSSEETKAEKSSEDAQTRKKSSK